MDNQDQLSNFSERVVIALKVDISTGSSQPYFQMLMLVTNFGFYLIQKDITRGHFCTKCSDGNGKKMNYSDDNSSSGN